MANFTGLDGLSSMHATLEEFMSDMRDSCLLVAFRGVRLFLLYLHHCQDPHHVVVLMPSDVIREIKRF